MLPSGTHSDIWQQTLQVVKCAVLQGRQTCTYKVFQVAAHSRLFNPHLWHAKEQCKGKCTGHRCSTSATLCPILAVAHRVAHLILHKAKSHQPLCSYYHSANSSYRYLASQDIMQVLRASALHHLRFCVNPASVECRSLRTSGAMALFSRGVDALLIKLVGRWRSDAMLRYMHVQSCPIMSRLSKLMLAGGNPQLLAETATMPLPNPPL